MPAQIEQLIRDRKDLWQKADTARDLWQELAEYCAIHRSNITVEREAGDRQSDKLFDSAAIYYAELLAAMLGGTLTSPAQKWFSLLARQEELNKQKAVRDFLEEIADRTYLATNQSNFLDEINEVYLDLVVFGTGCLFQEEGDPSTPNGFGGLRYTAVAIGEYAIGEGPDGRVNRIFRRLRMSHRAMQEKFGDKAFNDELRQKVTDKPDENIDIWHGCYPRDKAPAYRRQQSAMKMRWASCFFVETPGHILAEGGFHEFPFAVPRWSKVAGEVWGRGRMHAALPDIRTLNEAVRLYLEAAALAIRPPLVELENSVIGGSLSIEPAARNVEREKDSIRALDLGGKFQVALELFDRLERKISELCYYPQLHLKDSPAMTATEVVQRQEEKLRLLGPTAGRLHSELLSPTVERAVALQARANVLPEAPEELAQADAEVDIAYEGPLARAQRTVDLVAIERKNAYVAQVYPFYPEVVDNWDVDEEARHVSAVTGLPGNISRGEEQIAEIRANRAKAQADAAKLQAMAGAAEAAGKAAPMAKVMQDARQPAEAAA